jgi:transcriptional regulator with XRE-family HTH domain
LTSTQEPRYPIIGRTIRSLREEAGLTQEALALEVKISKSEVSRLEKGKRNPKWETMKRLAKGLGVPCWHMVAKAEQLEAGASKEETLRSPPG